MGKHYPCSISCSDCYKICEFFFKTSINNIYLDIQLLDLCINSCNFCITECIKHMEHHKVCVECVLASRLCIAECNQTKLNIMGNTNE